TGKTLTIHYLASQLREHTTLLIAAEHLFFIGEYFRLARFLQPAMMVIEDVDLIARERGHMQHPGQESLLNKLLNEMDGLREDADVLFILTTNRPDELEPALASRPGRIDQAIEFPLPDEEGSTKLVALYSRGLEVPSTVMDLIVQRTKGVSPAFIKELMRRSAQFQIEQGGGTLLRQGSVDSAIEEMVFAGGALNLKLLGCASAAAEHEIRQPYGSRPNCSNVNATVGSTEVARRVGTRHATAAIETKTAVTAANVAGSVAVTSTRTDCIRRVIASADANP